MNNNYKETFEQIKIAGYLAAEALDEVTSYVKPGVTTDKLDKICYDFIIEVFQNHVALLPIILCVTVFQLINI